MLILHTAKKTWWAGRYKHLFLVVSLQVEKVHTEANIEPVMSHILQTAVLHPRHLLKLFASVTYAHTHTQTVTALTCSWLHTALHTSAGVFWGNTSRQSPTSACQSKFCKHSWRFQAGGASRGGLQTLADGVHFWCVYLCGLSSGRSMSKKEKLKATNGTDWADVGAAPVTKWKWGHSIIRMLSIICIENSIYIMLELTPWILPV